MVIGEVLRWRCQERVWLLPVLVGSGRIGAVTVGIWLAEWSKECAIFGLSELEHTASLLENQNLTIIALLPYITPSSTDHFIWN